MGDASGRIPRQLMPRRGWAGLRRVLKWFAAALVAAVVLALLARAVLLHYAEKDLASVKAGLSFELVPSRELPTLWGPEPSPEKNAAPLYIEAEEKLSAILYPDDGKDTVSSRLVEKALSQDEPVEISPADLMALVSEDDGDAPWSQLQDLLGIWGFEEYYGEPAAEGEFDGFDDPAAEDDETDSECGPADDAGPPRDVAAAREFLAQFADVLKLRDEAVKRPWFRESLDWDHPRLATWSDGWVNQLTDLADLTLLESAIAAHEQQWDEAYDKVCTILLMVRHLEQPHLLRKQCFTSPMRLRACKQLARLLVLSPPSGVMSSRLRPLLEFDARQRLQAMIASEAAFTNGLFEDEVEPSLQGSSLNGGSAGMRLGRLLCWAIRPSLIRQHARVLETMGAYYEATGDAASYQRRCESIERDFASLSQHFAWQGPMSVECPGWLYYFIVDSYIDGEALGAMATVALDVAAFRQSRGRYPTSLSELSDSERLRKDPFTGKALLYRLTDDGFVLWSVGPDGDDDGGKTHEDLNCGLLEDGDIVLRVPPPDPNCGAADGDAEIP